MKWLAKAEISRTHARGRRLALVIGLLVLMPAIAWSVGKQPKGTNGPYRISVGGSCKGEGKAHVGGKRITLHAKVEDETGAKGNLHAPAMVLVGDHFTGDGTVMGRSATFIGRLDGYNNDPHFRGARILCSFTDSNGHSGRVAGNITP